MLVRVVAIRIFILILRTMLHTSVPRARGASALFQCYSTGGNRRTAHDLDNGRCVVAFATGQYPDVTDVWTVARTRRARDGA